MSWGTSNFPGTHPNKDRAREWEIAQLLKHTPNNSKILVLAGRDGHDIECLMRHGVDTNRIVAAEMFTDDLAAVTKKFARTDVTFFGGNVLWLPKKVGNFGAIYLDSCGVPSRDMEKLISFSRGRLRMDGVFAISSQVANRAKECSKLASLIENQKECLSHRLPTACPIGYVKNFAGALNNYTNSPVFEPLFGRYYSNSKGPANKPEKRRGPSYVLVGGRYNYPPRLSAYEKMCWRKVVESDDPIMDCKNAGWFEPGVYKDITSYLIQPDANVHHTKSCVKTLQRLVEWWKANKYLTLKETSIATFECDSGRIKDTIPHEEMAKAA